jgi:DNA-binding transcriptional ArsR family regulator
MEATDEPFYGTLSMLRLAGLASAADELAEAGFRRVDEGQLMPWAADEIFHAVMDRHVRNCVEAGATSESIEIMETELEKLDANMNPDVAEIRREMVERLAGQSQTDWVRNQLLGTDQKSMRNRYLLSFEFAAWLTRQRPIDSVAADELRGLILESLSREGLTMRNYFDGIPQSALDRHLASLLGFMSLDRFKAPATLIAVGHFVDFLADRGLTQPKSLRQSKAAIDALDKQVRRLLQDEWDSCKFLDRLRCS